MNEDKELSLLHVRRETLTVNLTYILSNQYWKWRDF